MTRNTRSVQSVTHVSAVSRSGQTRAAQPRRSSPPSHAERQTEPPSTAAAGASSEHPACCRACTLWSPWLQPPGHVAGCYSSSSKSSTFQPTSIQAREPQPRLRAPPYAAQPQCCGRFRLARRQCPAAPPRPVSALLCRQQSALEVPPHVWPARALRGWRAACARGAQTAVLSAGRSPAQPVLAWAPTPAPPPPRAGLPPPLPRH